MIRRSFLPSLSFSLSVCLSVSLSLPLIDSLRLLLLIDDRKGKRERERKDSNVSQGESGESDKWLPEEVLPEAIQRH